MARSPLVDFIVSHQQVLIQTDFAREIWMIPERITAHERLETDAGLFFAINCLGSLYEGKLFVHDGQFFAVLEIERVDDRTSEMKTFHVKAEPTGIVHDPNEKKPLCTPQDTFLLEAGEIKNYIEGGALETTIGIFIANYLFLVYPFGDVIPYLNDEFSASKLEKRISIPLLDGRISTRDVKDKYINAISLFGQSNEMICPNISEKTITIPKHIHDLRDKLVAENLEALESGDASVMSDIEQKLIAEYKKHLEDDPSLHFLLKSKYFNVTLKKLFLTQGMTEKFGQPGKFTFISQPMGSGWKKENLPDIFNEVRQGSYARAVETANGGVIAKLILRVLQDTRISIDDCGTKRGEHIHGTKDQLKDFIWNYVIEADGKTALITEENIHEFVGRDLKIRTPGYCQATQGFCAKCFGRLFEVLGQKAFAPVANDFARTQTTNSLKSMHGKSHSTVDVSNINKYLVGS